MHHLILSDSFREFLSQAREYCFFIETNKPANARLYLLDLQLILQKLYMYGQKIEQVELIHNGDFDFTLDKTETHKLQKFVAKGLDESRYYWHVFDPSQDYDVDPVCGDLGDDLLDIYKDIKPALLLYDIGGEVEIEAAFWNMKFNFDNHWGEHCINAIYAIHYFIKRVD